MQGRIPLEVTRTAVRLVPDVSRVVAKTFAPSGELSAAERSRIERLQSRLAQLSDDEVAATLDETLARFESRHCDVEGIFESNFRVVAARVEPPEPLSTQRRLLMGAYFTHEYSIEAAALSNPSIVAAPDQEGLAAGETRFVLSLRAIGEGHVSSIEFRCGVVDACGQIEVEPPGRFPHIAVHRAPIYQKDVFRAKLRELHAFNDVGVAVLENLPDRFTIQELDEQIRAVDQALGPDVAQATRTLHWLASSNYESTFSVESQLSERVLFPAGPADSRGMEDARFVRFRHDDGAMTYFATYTAFDGHQILPQLIETADFRRFRIATLNGACAKNKGIAIFPRKIDGKFFALARLDNENNFVAWSDDVRFWHEGEVIQAPRRAWELTQLGNCGSPLETEAGWLVITHGVGALRQYSIGAILLDASDPRRVIGRLEQPLLEPRGEEREGYVPNVAYSCGSMIAGELLVLPYGFSDVGTRIATLRLDDLLTELTSPRSALASK